ncbi:MAG: PorT family protein [Bacteroidetes bacterium]|nr:PorT family protein [Bacteroidota bacterium]
MKKVLTVILLVISVAAASAQTDSIGTAKPAKKERKPYVMNVPKDRLVLDLNATNWIHKNENGMKTQYYSRGLNLYAMYDLQIKKSRVSFAIGAGISWVNIYTNSRLTDSASSGARFHPYPLANYHDSIKINKLTETWIDVPLELRIRTNRDKLDQVWKFNIGFKFGVKVDAYTKVVFKNPHYNVKEKPYGDFNLFRMGPTLRIGYSSFNITGYYGLLNVFKQGRGPLANEWSLGISFNGL